MHALVLYEIRLIADGNLEKLVDFASSSRLHAADPKGDTPLHLAARMGNLAVCDLFIRSGANPSALNHDRQTPADVAFAEGHGFAAQLLLSLVARSSEPETVVKRDESQEAEIAMLGTEVEPEQDVTVVQQTAPDDVADDLDSLLSFEADKEPEEFYGESAGKKLGEHSSRSSARCIRFRMQRTGIGISTFHLRRLPEKASAPAPQ